MSLQSPGQFNWFKTVCVCWRRGLSVIRSDVWLQDKTQASEVWIQSFRRQEWSSQNKKINNIHEQREKHLSGVQTLVMPFTVETNYLTASESITVFLTLEHFIMQSSLSFSEHDQKIFVFPLMGVHFAVLGQWWMEDSSLTLPPSLPSFHSLDSFAVSCMFT